MQVTDTIQHSRTTRASALFPLVTLFVLALGMVVPAQAQVPAVVFSQANGKAGIGSTAGASDFGGTVAHIAANARGDVFANVSANNGAYLEEIPINGGAQTALITGEGSLYGGHSAYVDRAGNVWATDTGDAKILFVPFVNNGYPATTSVSSLPTCAFPVPTTQTADCVVNLSYPSSIGYYGQAADLGLDGSGDLFLLFKYTGGGSSYAGDDVIIEFLTNGTTQAIGGKNAGLSNDASGEIAVNAAGDVFVEVYGSVNEFAHSDYTTEIPIYSLNGPDGVTVDASGNLFITNNTSADILEYPYLNGTYNLPNTPVSIVSNQLSTGYSSQPSQGIAIDGFGRITMAGNYPNSISTLTVGSFAFGSTPVNTTSGSQTVDVVFNTTETLGGLKTVGPFNVASSTCKAGSEAVAANCSLTVTYSSSAVGTQLGQLVAYDNNGNTIGTAVLSGIGSGPTLTTDPGTNSTDGTGYTAPSAVTTDNSGNIFVADSSTGTIYKTSTGAVPAAVAVASGFTAPTAITVDGAENLYVAEAGQLVEVPYNSTTSTYGTPAVVLTGLNGASGVAIDTRGDVYVADSGNARVLLLASSGNLPFGSLVTTLGTGFTTPVAVAVDSASQNVYVSDAGTGSVVQINLVSSAQSSVLTGLTTAAGVAVDPSGTLYAVDSGKTTVTRLPYINGGLNPNYQTTLATIVKLPTAIAADNEGNLYVVDTTDATVATDNRSAGVVQFGNVTEGDSSSTVAGEVSNSGNASLTLSTPDYAQSGATSSFAIQSSSTCAGGTALNGGLSCTIAAIFTPQSYGVLTDTLALASSAPNAATLALTGTGTPVLIKTTLNLAVSAPATPTYNEPTTITATLVPASQGPQAPTGSVTFEVDSVVQVPSSPLNAAGTSASITIPKLSGGKHTITASYSGDYFYSSTSSGPLTVTVVQSSTVTTLSLTAPYSNPTSANPGTATNGQGVSLVATVAPPVSGTPTGVVTFYNGTTVLGTANVVPYSYKVNATTNFSEGQATLTINTGAIPLTLGQYEITATYAGDSNYTGSSSSPAQPLLISNPTIVLTSTASSITGTATAGNSANIPSIDFVVTSVAGFSNAINFTCSGLPAYSTCSFGPAYATVSPGAPATIKFEVLINQPPVEAVPSGLGGSARLPGHKALAGFLTAFLLLPALLLGYARRSGRGTTGRFSTMRISMIAGFLLLTGLAVAISGCGTGTNYNTPAGTTTITINALTSDPASTTPPSPTLGNPTPTATLQLKLIVP